MDLTREKLDLSLSRFQQILGCAICLDYPQSPMRTQCNHCFCKTCLDNLFRTSKNPAACPICKTLVNKRGLKECPQLESVIKVIQKLNTALESDWISMAKRSISEQPEKKEMVSSANAKLIESKTRRNKKSRNKVDGDETFGSKITSIKPPVTNEKAPVKASDSDIKNDKQKEPTCRVVITKADVHLPKNSTNKINQSNNNKKPDVDASKVKIQKDSSEETTHLQQHETSVPPNASSNSLTKVTQWLNNYCVTSTQCNSEDKVTEFKKLEVGVSPLNQRDDNVVDDDSDIHLVDGPLKKNTKIFKSRYDCKTTTSSCSTEKLEEDPYYFVGSQRIQTKRKFKPTQKVLQRKAKKNNPSSMAALIKECSEAVKTSRKTPHVFMQKMDSVESDVECDPYALFVTPALKETKVKLVKKSKTKKKKENTGPSKTHTRPVNVGAENELALLTNSLKIAESHDLVIESDTRPNFIQQRNKRKLKSSTHSFTESQADFQVGKGDTSIKNKTEDHNRDVSPNPILDDEVEISSKHDNDVADLLKNDLKSEPIAGKLEAPKTSKIKLTKTACIVDEPTNDEFIQEIQSSSTLQSSSKLAPIKALTSDENEDNDVEMITVNSENNKIVKSAESKPSLQPKHNVSFSYLGKLANPHINEEHPVKLKTFKSVGCQTDGAADELQHDVCQMAAFSIDNRNTVYHTPFETKSSLDEDLQAMQIDKSVTKSGVSSKASKNSEINVDIDGCSGPTSQQLTATSLNFVQPQLEALTVLDSEDKTNGTPTKPSKRRKTVRGLATMSHNTSKTHMSSPKASRVDILPAKRLFDFTKEEKTKLDPLPCEKSRAQLTPKELDKEVKKSYRRIQAVCDSSESDSEQQPLTLPSYQKNGDNSHQIMNQLFNSDNTTQFRSSCEILEIPRLSSTPTRNIEPSGMSPIPSGNINETGGWVNGDCISTTSEEANSVPTVDNELVSNANEEDLEFDDEEDEILNGNDCFNSDRENVYDDDDEELLYSSTPMKGKQHLKEELHLSPSQISEDTIAVDILPSESSEIVTTQNVLQLREHIRELEQKRRLMEKDLEEAEKERNSKIKKCSPLSQPKVTADHSLMEVSSIFRAEATTPQTTGLTIASKLKKIQEGNEAAKSYDNEMERNTTVSPSPQQKSKWTPSRVIKSEASTKLPLATTSKPEINSAYMPTRATSKGPAVLKPYSFVTSGVNLVQLKQVKQLAQVLNARFSFSFTPNITTHVIVNIGKDRLCERTFKYLTAISCGCWIVSMDWVVDSLSAGRGLPEEDYEAMGDNNDGAHGGPAKARLNPTPLLKDFKVLIMEPFKDLTKDQICSLLENCGARVVSHPSHIDSLDSVEFKQLILADKKPSDEVVQQYSELYQTHGLTTVNRDWLLDSVACYRVKPLDNYMLPPCDVPSSPRLH